MKYFFADRLIKIENAFTSFLKKFIFALRMKNVGTILKNKKKGIKRKKENSYA